MALCTHMLAIMFGYVCVAASSPFRLKWGDCRNHWQKFWAKVLVKYRYTVLRLLTKDFNLRLNSVYVVRDCDRWR